MQDEQQHAMQAISEDQKLNYGVQTLQGLFEVWTRVMAPQQTGSKDPPDPHQGPGPDGYTPLMFNLSLQLFVHTGPMLSLTLPPNPSPLPPPPPPPLMRPLFLHCRGHCLHINLQYAECQHLPACDKVYTVTSAALRIHSQLPCTLSLYNCTPSWGPSRCRRSHQPDRTTFVLFLSLTHYKLR